jgi:hypothetical protein
VLLIRNAARFASTTERATAASVTWASSWPASSAWVASESVPKSRTSIGPFGQGALRSWLATSPPLMTPTVRPQSAAGSAYAGPVERTTMLLPVVRCGM